MSEKLPIDLSMDERFAHPPRCDLLDAPDFPDEDDSRKTSFLNWRALLQALVGWLVLIAMFAAGWWLT